jgi:hypothetical protein
LILALAALPRFSPGNPGTRKKQSRFFPTQKQQFTSLEEGVSVTKDKYCKVSMLKTENNK